METAAIKPEPFNQYVSAGVVSGVATVSIGNLDRVTVCARALNEPSRRIYNHSSLLNTPTSAFKLKTL